MAEAAGLAPLPVLKHLAQIERQHRLVRAAGSWYVFDHHQVQEALYGSLSEPLQQAYHAALGQALEARGSEDVVAICEHYLRGGQGEKALPHLEAAFAHLEQNCSHARLLELADRALAAPGLLEERDRTNTLLGKAASLEHLGRLPERRSALEEAVEIASRLGEPALQAEALLGLGDCLMDTMAHDEASACFHRALGCAETSGDPDLIVRALGGLGGVAIVTGSQDQGCLFIDRALACAKESGDRRLERYATSKLALYLRRVGRYKEARPLLERCLDLAHELGDRDAMIQAMSCLATVLFNEDRGGECLPLYERALALAQESGNRRLELSIQNDLGLAYAQYGRWDDAQTSLERSLGLAGQTGHTSIEIRSLLGLGIIHYELGRFRKAEVCFERCVALLSRSSDQTMLAGALGCMGDLHTTLGRWSEAHTCLEQAVAPSHAGGVSAVHSQLLRTMSWLSASEGELDRAISHTEQSLAAAGENPFHEAMSLEQLADLLWNVGAPDARDRILAAEAAQEKARMPGATAGRSRRMGRLSEEEGKTEEAERFFREAVENARPPGQFLKLCPSLLELGLNLLQQGRFEEARTFLTEAYEIADAAGLENRAAYAACCLAALPGGDITAARELLRSREETLPFSDRMRARFLLWQAAGDPADLAEAKRLLQYLVDHAPEQYRRSMIENVRLHREIAAAALPPS